MAPIMPSTPEDQADFLLRTIVPYFQNDLDSLAESRCPIHSRRGGGPAFTLTVMSLAACEVIAELDGTGVGPKDRRRSQFKEISRLTGDPRYSDLGEILFVVFRHGIAHSFLPKGASAVTGMTMWINDSSSNSVCIDRVRGDLAEYRAGDHLRLDFGALMVYPQVLYLDVAMLLYDYEVRLRSRDAETLARLTASFPQWWADNANIASHHLNTHEWELVREQKQVAPLFVSSGPVLERGTDRVEFAIYRVQRGFRVTTTLNGVSTDEATVDQSEAEEYVFSRAHEMKDDGFQEVR